MDITVKMTPEEYDLFREYQKRKSTIEQEARTEYEKLCKRHESLCRKVLLALSVETETVYRNEEESVTVGLVSIKDNEVAATMVEIASDWFA